MSPKLITAALAATVICFAGVGVVTVKSVSKPWVLVAASS